MGSKIADGVIACAMLSVMAGTCSGQPGISQTQDVAGNRIRASIAYEFASLTINTFTVNGSISMSEESFEKYDDTVACNEFELLSDFCTNVTASCYVASCDLDEQTNGTPECDVAAGCLVSSLPRIRQVSKSAAPGTGEIAVEMDAASRLTVGGVGVLVCQTPPGADAVYKQEGASLSGCKSHVACANVSGNGDLVFTVRLKTEMDGEASYDPDLCGGGVWPIPTARKRAWSLNTVRVVSAAANVDCTITLDVRSEVVAVAGSGVTFSEDFVTSCTGTGCPTISVSQRDFSMCYTDGSNQSQTSFLNDPGDGFVLGDPDSTDQYFTFSIPITASSTPEDWFISMNSQDLSPVQPDFGGGAPFLVDDPPGCTVPHLQECPSTQIGIAPDGLIDFRDLQRLYASIGSSPGDCTYLFGVDLDGDGTIEETEANAFICGLMADLNYDGFVDDFDEGIYRDAFDNDPCMADVNMDGFTDFFDFDLYFEVFEFGPGCEYVPVHPCD